jgi:hypothetical protein
VRITYPRVKWQICAYFNSPQVVIRVQFTGL